MAKRIIIAGGGTGGHIFPALSIAGELKKRDPETEILFVGAKGGMEMTLVPKYKYKIKPVWISGIARGITLKNLFKNMLVPLKLLSSMWESRKILKEFKPDVAVGVGGYASGPLGRMATYANIPLVICEQNALPGITNKLLAAKANKVLLGNGDAKKHFEARKVIVTGNPIRASLLEGNREAGLKAFKFTGSKPVLLSLGGSLGAQSINRALEKNFHLFVDHNIQLLWQCGKRYYEELKVRIPQHPLIKLVPFIDDMPGAFAASDLVISRAGASTISELIMLSKPSILVPSPNVAEDHQTKNAMSLVKDDAAIIVTDAEANERLVQEAIDVIEHPNKLELLQKKIGALPKYDSAKVIVDEILALAENAKH